MEKTESRLIQNKYEIVSKIKQGGFGIVYYGYDHVFEKSVAIKAIEPSLLKEAKWVDLFMAEAKNAAKLSHNNIVHIYNLVTAEDGQLYIVMEYVDGMDLAKILRQSRKVNATIPLELSIYIIKEICKALEYAHNKRDILTDKPLKLVHQDISPSNIMISHSGHVKLIDFGLAKFRFQNKNSNELVISGKLPYMAPEQLSLTNGHIDRRTDIFSLGVTFYEMLTGTRLFPSDDPEQILESFKKLRIDTARLEQRNVPEPVQKILIKMLQKNPDDRYHGANGVYLDLVEYLMSSTYSVELSEELGGFIQRLFADSSNDIAASEAPSHDDIQETDQQIRQLSEELDKLIHEKDDNGKADVASDFSSEPFSEVPIADIDELKTASANYNNDVTQIVEESTSVPEFEFQQRDRHMQFSPADQVGMYNSVAQPQTEATSEIDIISRDQEKQSDFDGANRSEENAVIPEEFLSGTEEIPENGNSEVDLSDTERIIHQKFNAKFSRVEPEVKQSKLTPKPINEEEIGEDDLKTVIDVIRLSTRTHKKAITISAISVFAMVFLFMLFDIFLQMTSLGEAIFNRLFPPAIKITSAPLGAIIYLDKERIPGETPLSIPKIAPGVHELTLTHDGFAPLVKSIHVPSKGEIKVSGETARKGYSPYLFRFKTQIELNSEPTGAEVYLNQIKFPHRTPTVVEWEVGEPLAIEMEMDGFQKLTGFSLNTVDGLEEIDDRRLWDFESLQGENKRFIIQGNFKKFINIASVPPGITFFIDGATSPSGRTDVSSVIALSTGQHSILFQKKGFNSKQMNIKVDHSGPEIISVMLTRNVRFYAKDKNDPENNEIGARITKIIRNDVVYTRNDKTPCDIALPPVNLKVVLSREGYKDAVVGVSMDDSDVLVAMEPSAIDVNIKVSDALTGMPLKDAELLFRSLTENKASEVLFGKTDESGLITNKMSPGEFSFRVKKAGYFEKFAIINTKNGEHSLDFKLIIQ